MNAILDSVLRLDRCTKTNKECKEILFTDPYVQDDRITPLETLIEKSDILILAAPHAAYKNLDLNNKFVVDVWDFFGKVCLI